MEVLHQGSLDLSSLQDHLCHGLRRSKIKCEESISTTFMDKERQAVVREMKLFLQRDEGNLRTSTIRGCCQGLRSGYRSGQLCDDAADGRITSTSAASVAGVTRAFMLRPSLDSSSMAAARGFTSAFSLLPATLAAFR